MHHVKHRELYQHDHQQQLLRLISVHSAAIVDTTINAFQMTGYCLKALLNAASTTAAKEDKNFEPLSLGQRLPTLEYREELT